MKEGNNLEAVEQRIATATQALKEGRGILLVDDEDRENEGDIIYPTSNLTEKNIALMIRECSGIICVCMKDKKCQELELPPMVQNNTCKNQTAFTISIEAREGVTTGVSARDRLCTIQTAARPGAHPEDLVHPGHVFPLRARENGVLERRGHTEGSIDIVRIAGLGTKTVLWLASPRLFALGRSTICRYLPSKILWLTAQPTISNSECPSLFCRGECEGKGFLLRMMYLCGRVRESN